MLWDKNYQMNSEKPSIALEVFKKYNPKDAIKFAHLIQHALYYDGKSLNDINTYLTLIVNFGIDQEAFRQNMDSEEFKVKTYQEFKKSSILGVTGFPCVIMFKGSDTLTLSQGYTDSKMLTNLLQKHK